MRYPGPLGDCARSARPRLSPMARPGMQHDYRLGRFTKYQPKLATIITSTTVKAVV